MCSFGTLTRPKLQESNDSKLKMDVPIVYVHCTVFGGSVLRTFELTENIAISSMVSTKWPLILGHQNLFGLGYASPPSRFDRLAIRRAIKTRLLTFTAAS